MQEVVKSIQDLINLAVLNQKAGAFTFEQAHNFIGLVKTFKEMFSQKNIEFEELVKSINMLTVFLQNGQGKGVYNLEQADLIYTLLKKIDSELESLKKTNNKLPDISETESFD